MSKPTQSGYQESIDVLSFLGSVRSSINEIGSKVIDGKLRPENIDLKKFALEYDASRGITPQSKQPPALPQQHSVNIPVNHVTSQVQNLQPVNNTDNGDQLLLPFDKKSNLDDIFNKIDDVYRKVISLENEVYKLRESLDNKKKDL